MGFSSRAKVDIYIYIYERKNEKASMLFPLDKIPSHFRNWHLAFLAEINDSPYRDIDEGVKTSGLTLVGDVEVNHPWIFRRFWDDRRSLGRSDSFLLPKLGGGFKYFFPTLSGEGC